MWEDEANKHGGRWTLRVSKGYANKLWEDLLLATIGEQFTDANEINGIVVSVKNAGDQIAIWTRNAEDLQIRERIRQDLIRLLNLPEGVKVDYEKFFKDEPHVPRGPPMHHKLEKPARGGPFQGAPAGTGYKGAGGQGMPQQHQIGERGGRPYQDREKKQDQRSGGGAQYSGSRGGAGMGGGRVEGGSSQQSK